VGKSGMDKGPLLFILTLHGIYICPAIQLYAPALTLSDADTILTYRLAHDSVILQDMLKPSKAVRSNVAGLL